ncbi:MAG: hypothetical protein ACT4OF_03915 [Caulobacteraceae bacterium]
MRSTIGVVLNVAALLACACALLVALPARALVDCGMNDTIYSADPRLRGSGCEEVTIVPIRWSGGEARMRVVRTVDADVERGVNATAWIRETAARVGSALDVLGGDYRLGQITVVITALDPLEIRGLPAYAFAYHKDRPGDCIVPVYPPSGSIETETAMAGFVFAHEIFHCAQFATWPETTRSLEQSWWMEGSAEYFANVAFPGPNAHSTPQVHSFDRRSPDTSLLNMTYDNFVLFAWLYESGGSARFRYFLQHVASVSGSEHRAAAESAFAPEVWQDFAQQYIDQRLHYPGGAPLDSHPSLTPEHDASAETPIVFRALPLVLARASIRVEPGRYRFATTVTHGPYAASHEEGAWAPLPATMETECDGERVIKLATMTASNAGVQVEIRSTREGEAACSCAAATRSRNSCLVGTWSFAGYGDFCGAFAARLIRGGASLMECNPGTSEVTFSRDGTVVAQSTGTRALVQMSHNMMMETTQSVESRAFWGTAGDQLDFCDAGSILTGMTIISGPGSSSSSPSSQATPIESGSATFTCTRTTLTIVNHEAPGTFLGIGPEMALHRVR